MSNDEPLVDKHLQILTVDLETTQKSERSFKADPLDSDNRVVLAGVKRLGEIGGCSSHPSYVECELLHDYTTNYMVVGQNFKFDSHYLSKHANRNGSYYNPHKFNIWDTQLAEYILTAQQSKTISLDKLSEKYGGTPKDTRVSAMFESGMGSEDIPEELLKDYLIADLNNTELVFLQQFQEAEKQGQLPLILSQMGALQCTIEMSYNGMAIDKELLEETLGNLQIDLSNVSLDIYKYVANKLANTTAVLQFNINSNQHIASIIFTGEFDYRDTEVLPEVYKSGIKKGQNKTRKITKTCKFIPMITYNMSKHKKTPSGLHVVDEEMLSGLILTIPSNKKFRDNLLNYKLLNKQISTYYQGMLDALYPDGCIHPSYNHSIASTGRLTSSGPNLQNVTNGPIKKVFVSRYEGGKLVEIDYGQLEILGLAIITGDIQLISDIVSGQDIHTALYSDMNHRLPTKEERKAFKPFSFGLIYGASATTLAHNASCDKQYAQKFIDTFYKRYPGVKQWHEEFPKEVLKNRTISTLKDDDGIPIGTSTWQAPTGRKYLFKEYKAPEWVKHTTGKSHTFSPTEMKNYPVQGFATGDVVPHMLGVLYKAIKNNPDISDKCLLINTVHDSIMLDVTNECYVNEVVKFVTTILENTPKYISEHFSMALPFKKMSVGVSVGDNWFDMEEVDVY